MYKKDSGSGHAVFSVELKNSLCSFGRQTQHLTVKAEGSFSTGKQLEWRLIIEPRRSYEQDRWQPRNINKTFKIEVKEEW